MTTTITDTNATISLCVLSFLLALLAIVYLQPKILMDFIVAQSAPSVFWRASTSARVCALTIDDVPSPITHELLDVLLEHNVKATFFIVSGNVPGREEVIHRMIKEGHVLGNHLTEDRASILDPLEVFEEKLRECDQVLQSFNGTSLTEVVPLLNRSPTKTNTQEKETQTPPAGPIKWLRPASGWFTSGMRKIVERHGYNICMGSVYPHDAQVRFESINAAYLRWRTTSGSVIIVHDRKWTVGVLRKALPELVRQFKFVTVDELTYHHKRT